MTQDKPSEPLDARIEEAVREEAKLVCHVGCDERGCLHTEAFRALARKVRDIERERCAVLAETAEYQSWSKAHKAIAAAIRGNQ